MIMTANRLLEWIPVLIFGMACCCQCATVTTDLTVDNDTLTEEYYLNFTYYYYNETDYNSTELYQTLNDTTVNDTDTTDVTDTTETIVPTVEFSTTPTTASTTEDWMTTETRQQREFRVTTSKPKEQRIQCGRRLVRSGRIVGGKDAYEGEFPWTVSVRLLTTHFCGGTIINKQWILTAAHCVKRYGARYFRVRMGENDINVEESRPDIDMHVEQINVHPEFGQPRRYSNDIAVIKLKKALKFSAFALPICLPTIGDSSDHLVGKNATVVGWGWLNEVDKGKSVAKKLQKVQVPVLNNSLCEKWYSEEYKGHVEIHNYQICAGYKEGGRDSCQGDSGGPLILKEGGRFTIIGVVSAGVGCARKHMPGIYSRVSSFVPWIKNVTGIQDM